MRIKNVVERVESIYGNIPKNFDMDAVELEQLKEHYKDTPSLLCAMFRFGFIQGQKAKEKELIEEPADLKTKNDYRKAIYSCISRNKNSYALRYIYKMVTILWKKYDDNYFTELREEEWLKSDIIIAVINMDSMTCLKMINGVIHAARKKRMKE